MALNLLPKDLREFRSKDYWDKFFNSHKAAFEWYYNIQLLLSRCLIFCCRYAEFKDLRTVFRKSFSEKDAPEILVVGCGNSELSSDLFDAGFTHVTSIDYSQVSFIYLWDLLIIEYN